MTIANKSGIWLISSAAFPLIDSLNGTRFEPGVATKALRSDWVKGQPTITRCGDPSSDLTEKEQAQLDADNAADAAERDGAVVFAEHMQAVARGEASIEDAPAAAEPKVAKAK